MLGSVLLAALLVAPGAARAADPAEAARQEAARQQQKRVALLQDKLITPLRHSCDPDVQRRELSGAKKTLDASVAEAGAGAAEVIRVVGDPATIYAAYEQKFKAISAETCSLLCPAGGADNSAAVDVCALAEPVLANAAVMVDSPTLLGIQSYLQAQRQALRAAGADLVKLRAALAAAKAPVRAGGGRDMALGAGAAGLLTSLFDVGSLTTGTGAAIDAASFTATTVATGLQALARVIEDRAKREGIGWFLQQVGDNLCGVADEEKDELRYTQALLPYSTALRQLAALDAGASKASWERGMAAVAAAVKQLADPGDLPSGVKETSDAVAAWAGGEAPPALRNRATSLVIALKLRLDGDPDAKQARGHLDAILTRREIRTFWFPALCSLAGKGQDFLQYGGGAKMLEGLRAAVTSDVKAWPGAAAGLGLGATFWSRAGGSGTLFQCSPTAGDPLCQPALRLRGAGAVFLTQVLAGGSIQTGLATLAGEIDGANHQPGGAALYDDGLQIAACAASIPGFLQDHAYLTNAFDGDRVAATETLLLGAFTGMPACWTIFGQGLSTTCQHLGGTEACSGKSPARALGAPGTLERLTTLIRLHHHYGDGARAVAAQWERFEKSWAAYLKAATASQEAPGTPVKAVLPDASRVTASKDVPDAVRAATDYLQAAARLVQNSAQAQHLQAALALAQSGFELVSASLGAVEKIVDPKLYPGCAHCQAIDLRPRLEEARAAIAVIARDIAVVRSIMAEDWGTVVTSSLQSVSVHVRVACSSDVACAQVLPLLSRHLGLVVALATEKDPDKLAQAIDQAAAPPGGWRRKGQPGTFTLSLASFPGVILSAGEGRWGQYGVFREDARKAYYVAPSLVMPVGLDFAWGNTTWLRPFGVFVSFIDPIAFLQYDVSKDGRLPGPRITTVLAPGIWLRLGIKDTPFSLHPFVVYRPGLRAWESSVNGPAADALQYGVSASIDVTLFELVSKELKP
jgi:hypothetical protein